MGRSIVALALERREREMKAVCDGPFVAETGNTLWLEGFAASALRHYY